MRWITGSVLVAPGLVAILLTGCNGQARVDAKSIETPPARVEEAPDPNLVTVARPELFQVVSVEMKSLPNELAATGVIAPDVSRNVPVVTLTSGRVVEVRARLGDEVKKGQVLLTITSPEMSSAISDYEKFQADERLARSQLERSQTLYSHGAVAQKDLQIAEDSFAKAEVDTRTAARRIEILGGDLNHPTPVIEVRAPVSGTIVEQNVTNAAGVKSLDSSPNLFTIADLSHVWVLCDVYENSLSQVHLGDKALIELNAFPGRRFEGQVSNISSVLDPNTRTAKVRIDLPNPAGLMRPNMFATVSIISQSAQKRMMLPAGAILRLQDRDWVFLKLSENRFRRTEVQGGPATRDGVQQVLSGVQPGDLVVADALQFSRAAENAREQSEE